MNECPFVCSVIYDNIMFTFRYRLYPSTSQQDKFWLHANKLNNLYNYFLNQRIENYKKGKKITKSMQQNELTQLRQKEPSLQEIHSQVLQQITYRLDNSYKDFFRRVSNKTEKPGFPKFRTCKKFFGICYPQSGFTIENNTLITKIYGKIKFLKHREIIGNIRQIYIKCINNKWYLSITTDHQKPFKDDKKEVGIDVGLKNLIVASDGYKVKNCTHAKYFSKQISKLQSRRDKLKKGSNRRNYLNKVIQRLYDAKSRKINDFQHKVSKDLTRKYDTIYVENLSVKKMLQNNWTSLNKAISEAKLSQFIWFLQYKGRNTIKVNPAYTSKTCNKCWHVNDSLKLSNRLVVCECCGEEYDRDENASKNIFCLGQAINQGLCTQESFLEEALPFTAR